MAEAAVHAYPPQPAPNGLLRLLTCGSVDDGKSTLIGRLLYETKSLYADQVAALERDSRKFGTTGDIDFALLPDGLEAERQQGITIDVAYRFFATARRTFIIADAPGHEQYTRNMATAASTADLAIVLVDARNGVTMQTRRHSQILSLLGVRSIVLAVNKMDLVGFDEEWFAAIRDSYLRFAEGLEFAQILSIPTAARYGDNLTTPSSRMPWYAGPALLEHLEEIDVETGRSAAPFRMPVQWVTRADPDFRGYAGTIASGSVRIGDPVLVARSGTRSTITQIVSMDGDLEEASADEAVTLVLKDALDIDRGELLAGIDTPPEVSDQFAANLIWMGNAPLLPGRTYLLKTGGRTVPATVTRIKHKLDVTSSKHLAADDLRINEIGFCNVSLSTPIAFDPYRANRTTGAFILIDRLSNATVAAGLIAFGLRRAANLHWQALDVDKTARATLKAQTPVILWFTGLSGAGKSTIANLVERNLHALGRHTYALDGDNLRHGLNRDLGFTEADRVENIRRVAEVAKLFVDAGLIVLVSLISPFRAERRMARELVEPGEFIEIFVDTPLAECRRRDPKGLYRKADEGMLKNFTGIDSPYEPPENPDLCLDTMTEAPEALAGRVIGLLQERGII